MLPKMDNKDLTTGEREAMFILKNENKTYAEIAKLLKISTCITSCITFEDKLFPCRIQNDLLVIKV
jgi:hypothetical protein